ncbi:MAG: anti-sigma factor family protein [Steroidobacteraceae bacterium]
MHPDLAELLKLRDASRSDGPAAEHVAGCDLCRTELERLRQLRTALRALPDVGGPDRWPEAAARLEGAAVSSRPLPRPTWRLAGTMAAVLAIAVGLAVFDGSTPQRTQRPDQVPANSNVAAASDSSVAALIEESKRLERLLAAIPGEPRVARATTVMTTAGLEDRIQWVDLAIGAGEERDFDSTTVMPLWRQRVDLMKSLVAVRYAEARTVAY